MDVNKEGLKTQTTLVAAGVMTEFQQVVEDQRVAQLHLANLLRILLQDADTEKQETLILAALKFAEADYDMWARLDVMANEQAKKGGAQ